MTPRDDAHDVSLVLSSLQHDGHVKMFSSVQQDGNETWTILHGDGGHGEKFSRKELLLELRRQEALDQDSLPLLASESGTLAKAVATYLLGCPVDDSGMYLLRRRRRYS